MKIDILFICEGNTISSRLLLGHGETVLRAYKYQKRIISRLRYISHLLHLEKGQIFQLNPEITKFDAESIIIDGTLVYEPIIAQLRRQFPKSIIKYTYPNVVANKASMNPDVLRKYNCQLYSWDIEDCRKYKLVYTRSWYDKKMLPTKPFCIDYDLCFIGLDKGRYKMLKSLNDYSQKHGLRFYSHICANYNFLKWVRPYYDSPITYEEYLNITTHSNCIVDFVQEGQSGTTMRTMEAIFWGKKLISNNQFLRQMDFYIPDNIFIVENGSFEGLTDFLEKDVVPISPDILDRYRYEAWRKAIMEPYDQYTI